MRFVVAGVANDRRLRLFGEALARRGWPAPRFVPYRDILQGGAGLRAALADADAVRIECPGGDFDLERELIALACGEPDEWRAPFVPPEEARGLRYDHGRIRHLRQLYVGFRALLRRLARDLESFPAVRRIGDPDEIAIMCDKDRCQAHLERAGVPIAPRVAVVWSHALLRAALDARRLTRVFLKPLNGSSASGVLAYRTAPGREQATTSVELVRSADGPRLFNSLRVRTYDRPEDVRAIVDALGPEGLWVEEWLPKASIAGHTFDVRVVVVGGRARHTMLRLSRSPLTNLHLGNRRGDPALLVAAGGRPALDRIHAAAEAAAAAFPRSLHVGVDLLLTPGFRRVAVLEVNAFGDLLPGWLEDGRDTYDVELDALAA